jgi:hypothetical protein
MYPTAIGGSALLHVLAAHPKLIAVLGIAATVGMLHTPLGTGDYAGVRGYAAALERRISGQNADSTEVLDQARARAEALARLPQSRVDDLVHETLHACGARCLENGGLPLTADPESVKAILLLHELDPELARGGQSNLARGGQADEKGVKQARR